MNRSLQMCYRRFYQLYVHLSSVWSDIAGIKVVYIMQIFYQAGFIGNSFLPVTLPRMQDIRVRSLVATDLSRRKKQIVAAPLPNARLRCLSHWNLPCFISFVQINLSFGEPLLKQVCLNALDHRTASPCKQ